MSKQRHRILLAIAWVVVGLCLPPAEAFEPPDARKDALARAAGRRKQLAARPAGYDKAQVLRCLGPGYSGVWAGAFRFQQRLYVLTIAAAPGQTVPVAVEVAAPTGEAPQMRVALGKLVHAGDGLIVQAAPDAAARLAPLHYAGPVLVKVGDRVVVLTPDGPRPGRISPLATAFGDSDFLPGAPTARPLIIDPQTRRRGTAPRGAPVVLAETGTVIGAVTGQVGTGTSLMEFELLRFGHAEAPADPMGQMVFGTPIPADVPAKVLAHRKSLFPAAVCRFAPGTDVGVLVASRPYLRRRESVGWESLGRGYFFDTITYTWMKDVVKEVRLETVGSRFHRPGRAEAGLAAAEFCLSVYGSPKALKYVNRSLALEKRVEYNACLTWEPAGLSVYLLLTVKGPELKGMLLISPRGTPLTHVLRHRDVKDVNIKPLDRFVAREFVRQWLVRTLGADPTHPLHKAVKASGTAEERKNQEP